MISSYIKRLYIVLASLMITVSVNARALDSLAIDGEHGTLNVIGELVEGACWIDNGSVYQQIELGEVNFAELADENANIQPRRFFIALRDCIYYSGDMRDARNGNLTTNSMQPIVKISFATVQEQEQKNVIEVEGMAQGISLRLSDSQYRPVYLNDNNRLYVINSINDKLIYNVQVVRNNHKLIAGPYRATLNFKLDYD
ncbi:fimbrial protein [Citrobacter meridianamericanus]